jgi:hypothetical protein
MLAAVEFHPEAGADPLRRLLHQSKLLLFLKRLVTPIVQGRNPHSARHALDLAARGEIRHAFPDRRLGFIHVPDKFEGARGRYDSALADPIKDHGIEYLPALERCAGKINAPFTAYIYPSRNVEKILTLLTNAGRAVCARSR